MRCPPAWYQIVETLTERLPALSPAQVRGLATWVYGTLAAHSGCQSAVIAAWLAAGAPEAAVRGRLREFVYDGADKAAPCTTEVEPSHCFAALLAWVLDWWTDADRLVLAVDATNRHDTVTALVVSVLYRGSAIPVAWQVYAAAPKAPGQARDSWTAALITLLTKLRPVIPPRMQVLVLADAGLRSPRLRRTIRRLGFRPLLRLASDTWVRPVGQADFVRAPTLAPTPGTAWAGRATVFKQAHTQVQATLVVVWDTDQRAPWVLLTDLRPRQVGVVWYGLRMWIELGFRALKGVGWRWTHTRRTDPTRIARHWLVLAVATLWSLAIGTRAEDAARVGRDPAHLRYPPPPPVVPPLPPRRLSVFARGWALACRQLHRGRLWTRLWLTPEPWPQPLPRLQITYHLFTPG
jgi:hypothetical protein